MARKKLDKSNPVVAQEMLPGLAAPNSKSSRSRGRGAKAASTTNPARNTLARFILGKYVSPENINYGRDMTVAYKLADRHPSLEFWKLLTVKRQVPSLIILWSEESRRRLTREYEVYQKRLAVQRAVILDLPSEKHIIHDEKFGPDAPIPERRPRSIIEFCK